MKEFILYILNQIITQPDALTVDEIDENGFITYTITVADEDMGYVIGKNGKTIRSIRSLVRSKAIKDGVRVRVDLKDPKEGQQPADDQA